ncbi:MAG TPA: trehalose-phosphatase [Dehalococcoidia bacterium]|nr:trehalose-phosphatase [Dehalococcoidia bacterium]
MDSVKGLISQSPFGLITDVDGTISETAPTPQEARVNPLCRHYLLELCSHLPLVAAISGRSVAQVRDMVGIDGMVYVGNHGLEIWAEGKSELAEGAADYPGVIAAVIAGLSRRLPMEGLWIEDKRLTASVHYRLHPAPEQAKEAILAALRQLPQARRLRIILERKAIDILPPAASKGTAVADLMKRYRLRAGLYLGDDFTDVDAFRAVRTAARGWGFRGFAIGVISQEMPENFIAEADFTLNGVSDVAHFLEWLSQTVAPPA